MSTEQSFDADLARLNTLRNSQIGDVRFLLSFVDKLWAEYTKTLIAHDRLTAQGKWPCPMCSEMKPE